MKDMDFFNTPEDISNSVRLYNKFLDSVDSLRHTLEDNDNSNDDKED